MSLRKLVYTKVSALPGLGIAPANVFSSGATGLAVPGKSPTRPFAVVRFQPDAPGLLSTYPVHQQRFNVWVHDEPGTMERIDTAVKVLKEDLPGALPGVLDGLRVIECVWEGTFSDGYDDHFGTNVTYVDFMATYKPAP